MKRAADGEVNETERSSKRFALASGFDAQVRTSYSTHALPRLRPTPSQTRFPFEDLIDDLKRLIALEYCDAATQRSLFQTSRGNRARFAKEGRPNYDVGVAMARYGYTELFNYWTRNDCPASQLVVFRGFIRPLDALVYQNRQMLSVIVDYRERLRNKGIFIEYIDRWLEERLALSNGWLDARARLKCSEGYPCVVPFALTVELRREERDLVGRATYLGLYWRLKLPASTLCCACSQSRLDSNENHHLSHTLLHDSYGWAFFLVEIVRRRDAEELVRNCGLAEHIVSFSSLEPPALVAFRTAAVGAFCMARPDLLPLMFGKHTKLILDELIQEKSDGPGLLVRLPYAWCFYFDTSGSSLSWLENFYSCSVTLPSLDDGTVTEEMSERDLWYYSRALGVVPQICLPPLDRPLTTSAISDMALDAKKWHIRSRYPLHKEFDLFLADYKGEQIERDTLFNVLESGALSNRQAEEFAKRVPKSLVNEFYERAISWDVEYEHSVFGRTILARADAPETSLKTIVKRAVASLEGRVPFSCPFQARMAGTWTREEVKAMCPKEYGTGQLDQVLDFCSLVIKSD